MTAPPIYLATILEIERRRLARGIPMEQMSELMGSAERSYAKLLYPDTKSGRTARHETLQLAVSVLFPEGFDLRITPSDAGELCAQGTKAKIRSEASHWNARTRRETMQRLQALSREAYMQKTDAARRSAASVAGGKARWAGVTADDRAAIARRNGARAASKLTAQQRSEKARKAAAARWLRVRGETQGASA